jgi:hypothetical protein
MWKFEDLKIETAENTIFVNSWSPRAIFKFSNYSIFKLKIGTLINIPNPPLCLSTFFR